MALTAIACKNAKAGPKVQKLSDGGGLYLEVSTAGTRTWRWKYRHGGKERALNLGTFPDVGLEDARRERSAAKQTLMLGIDPGVARQIEAAKAKQDAVTFGTVMDELRAIKVDVMRSANSLRCLDAEYRYLRHLRAKPIRAITPADLIATIKAVMPGNGKNVSMAHSVRGRIGQVYALAVKRRYIAPAENLRDVMAGELPTHKTKHHKAITDLGELATLLRTIRDGEYRSPSVKHALLLLPHLFGRSIEICGMRWKELDLEKALWIVPASRMKMGRAHAVPLSKQALAIIEMQRPYAGENFVFPNMRDAGRTMERKALIKALVRQGYGGLMTAHGFRATASTLLEYRLGYSAALVEDALAHKLKTNEVSDAQESYKRPEYLWPQRIRMMQHWSDFLDDLASGAIQPDGVDSNVVPFPLQLAA